MKFIKTEIPDVYIIEPSVFGDNRGYFLESFNLQNFEKNICEIKFIQDNESKSSKGVLRGLHFQKGTSAQAKLVQVLKGKVLDVCVDIRKDSPTFGQHFSIVLDPINKKQLYVPRGFAHGFVALENDTIFSYKCDNYYDKSSESGIIYNDTTVNINWGIPEDEMIISEKDLDLETFENLFD